MAHTLKFRFDGVASGGGAQQDDAVALLVGGASGQIKTGMHRRYKPDTPMANLLLTMLDMVGVRQDKLGDSSGHLSLA